MKARKSEFGENWKLTVSFHGFLSQPLVLFVPEPLKMGPSSAIEGTTNSSPGGNSIQYLLSANWEIDTKICVGRNSTSPAHELSRLC